LEADRRRNRKIKHYLRGAGKIKMLEVNKIYCGDCLELMKEIEDKSVDLIIIDPPYFNQGTKPKYTRKGKKDVNTYFGEWDKFETDEDYLKWMKLIICECCRVLKEDGSFYCFTNDRYISYLRHFIRDIDNMTYASTLIWHKYNSPPRFIMKAGFISSKELIMLSYKGKNPTFNKPKEFKEMLDVWITPQTPSGERLGHPTQKPLSLIKRFIEISSNEGDLVLDSFVGSGTTAVACINTNRRFIGIELEPKYVEIANKRIQEEISQTKLTEVSADSSHN
jgi:DNA modification methylase